MKIIFFTGNRSEFGLLAPIISRVNSQDDMDCKLLVTGAHLNAKFGASIKEIEKEFHIDYYIPIESSGNSDKGIIDEVCILLREISRILESEKPDYLFVLGDRYETFAAAQAAFFTGTAIAHSGGGNITQGGCLDDNLRHLISRMAKLHFVTCEENAENLKKLGINNENIFIVGSTSVETAMKEPLLSKKELEDKFGISFKEPVILFTQHPVASSWEMAADQVRQSLIALSELGYQTIITFPNTDAGGAQIIYEYEKWRGTKNFIFIKSVGRINYLSLLKYASVVVGNSSSGLLETPIFKIPAVNIGNRQKGRIRSTNVIDVKYDAEAIKGAVKKALFDKDFIQIVQNCRNPFGNGNTSEEIVRILKERR